MKKVVALAVAALIALSVPADGWDGGDDHYDAYSYHRHHHRYDYHGRYDGWYGHRRYYDPYDYRGRYDDYCCERPPYFGDRPLRFRFKSPDFDLDIRG